MLCVPPAKVVYAPDMERIATFTIKLDAPWGTRGIVPNRVFNNGLQRKTLHLRASSEAGRDGPGLLLLSSSIAYLTVLHDGAATPLELYPAR